MAGSWEDLKVWKSAHDLVQTFPPDERYGLTQPLKRAAGSMTANIVEGFNRLTPKDKIHFYNIRLCSTEEIKYGLMLARDRRFCPEQPRLRENANGVCRMLSGLIASVRNRKRF